MAGVIKMPDIDYINWVNKNRDLLDEIMKSNKIDTAWLQRGQNKKFLVRYFHECGYTITIK